MRDGVLFINGKPVKLTPDGIGSAEEDDGSGQPANRYIETLPGGVSHTIFKIRDNGRFDNTPEVLVPTDRLFVMETTATTPPTAGFPSARAGSACCQWKTWSAASMRSSDRGISASVTSRSRPGCRGFRVSRFFSSVH